MTLIQSLVWVILLINPPNVPKRSSQILKYLCWSAVLLPLCIIQQIIDPTVNPTRQIETGTVRLVLSQKCIIINRTRPIDIPRWNNAGVLIRPGENTSIIGIPRPPQRTLPSDVRRNRCIRCMDLRICDIDTVVIWEGCVRAFPCGDSTATVAKLDIAGLKPSCSEAVQEVRLTGYDTVVEICAAIFTDVHLKANLVRLALLDCVSTALTVS